MFQLKYDFFKINILIINYCGFKILKQKFRHQNSKIWALKVFKIFNKKIIFLNPSLPKEK